MPGELGSQPYGMPVTIDMIAPAPAANATTNFGTDQSGTGFVVPAGYAFHPMLLSVNGSAAVTAGSATFNVTDNQVAIPNGPTVTISSVAPTQRASAVQRLSASPIAAGHVVGVNIVANAGYLPVTANWDASVAGVLIAV